MIVAESYPEAIEQWNHIWIPMPDGVRLAARVWLPKSALQTPVPAIVEYIPYRKSEGMSARDQQVHPYFAGHGYAALRIDLRGSGDSEGILTDEYTTQELQDGLDALRWIADQPWCNGRIGMMGISWGGFNALQLAALQPPNLQAILTVGSTDDRYADDVHYMGGCLLSANLTWSQTFFADLSRPPDPAVVGENWREQWLARSEQATFFIERWLAHQRRDAYWRHGSVCEDFSAIRCPVYAVGGWADSYTNAVLRLLSGLKVPCRGLIGPWAHDYPHLAKPDPAIDFLGEALRWWDHWLKDRDTGIMREPLLRAWVQEEIPADPSHDRRPGRWVGVAAWPSPDVATRRCAFAPGGLADGAEAVEAELRHASPQTLGWTAGEWCPYAAAADQAADQREDDGAALCFDSLPLDEAVEILGTPRVELELSVDRPQAFVAVRLNDVAPDGASSRVSYGLLNLTHREGHETPQPLEPGRRYRVTVTLNDVAYRFRPGHRIRVALSTAYWPTVWPSPEPVLLTLYTGRSGIDLPLYRPADATPLPAFPPPRAPAPERRTTLRSGSLDRSMHHDLASGLRETRVVIDHGEERIEQSGMVVGRRCDERYAIKADDPLSARITTHWTMTLRRDAWRVRTESYAELTATKEAFLLSGRLDLLEEDRRIATRSWSASIPRDGV